MTAAIVSNDDIRAKLSAMSQKVYSKDLDALDKTQVADLISLDLGMIMVEMTVSASETRPAEQKYSTNNYFASAKVDLGFAKDYIFDEINGLEGEPMLERYLTLKALYYNMGQVKWEGHESYLRGLIRTAQEKDNILPQCRWNQ